MSDTTYPYLLVLVEGPSEARTGESGAETGGMAQAVTAYVFGPEVARNIKVDYWKRTPRSPLRVSPEGRRICARAAQVKHAIMMANATTAYGAVILVDNDHLYERGCSTRLEELREGAESSGLKDRVAFGVAREMVEAWLLADSSLVKIPLPAGKHCEDLWGDKHDPESNFPKHVVTRCILIPGRVSFADAVDAWNVERSRHNSDSLNAFASEVEALADRQYAR